MFERENEFVADADIARAHGAAQSATAELEEIMEIECSTEAWGHITEALRLLRIV